MQSKSAKLAERLVEKKAALQRKKLALEKAARRLSILRRRQKIRCLVQYGTLFEEAGLADCSCFENLFDREVVLGFLGTMKEGQLTAEEMERFCGYGKIRFENQRYKGAGGTD